jgi:alpha-glucosidase
MFVKKYLSHSKMENGWLIHADCADILIVFLTDDIVRMRVSFERNFPEASYALVTTAWEDRLDPLFEGERQRVRAREIPCEERENSLCFQTASMKLVMKKAPKLWLRSLCWVSRAMFPRPCSPWMSPPSGCWE